MEKICLECKQPFVPKRAIGRQPKYCSRKCYQDQYDRHPDDTRNTPKDAICGVCQKPFVKKKRNQRYCSRAHYEIAWRTLNREKFNARAVARRNRDVEKSRKYDRELYRTNRPKLLSSRPWAYLFISRKNDARIKNIPFELTHEWAAARWTGKCELTGIEFKLSGRQGPHPFSPSIDKIDRKKGYTKNNSRFVLLGCNTLKGSGTDEDMYFIAEALTNGRKYLRPGPA